MNFLDTSQIKALPEDVLIAWSGIGGDEQTAMLSMPEGAIVRVLNLKVIEEFGNEQRKKEHVTSRVLLLLSCMKRGWGLDEFNLLKTDLGKPYLELKGKHKFISFSHSKDMVMCATADSMDIGLDIEPTERKVNPAIVKRILSENEWKLHSKEDPIRLWTMKEAAVKSLGTGLRTNLRDLELQKISDQRYLITVNEDKQLNVVSFNAEGHYIAIAWH